MIPSRVDLKQVTSLLEVYLFRAAGEGASALQKAFSAFFLFDLYLIGIWHWMRLFRLGVIPWKIYDWPKELAYFQVIKQWLQDGIIPYHVSSVAHGTNRFLGLPETILSPQVYLLKYLDPGIFVLIHVMILYSIGFYFLMIFAVRYRLSLIIFSALFLIFNFNGYIVSHLIVGHTVWAGYFLLPGIFYLIFRIAERTHARRHPLLAALLLWFLLLQGSFHIYVFCILFLSLMFIFNGPVRKEIFWIVVWSGFLGCFRFLPGVVAFSGYHQAFISGFPTLIDLWDSLVRLPEPGAFVKSGYFGGMYIWEYDIFISLIGVAFLCWGGGYLRLNKKFGSENIKFSAFDFPIFLMLLFSLNSFYKPVFDLPIPFMNSERLPSRFIIIPVLILLMVSCVRAQRYLDERRIPSAYILFSFPLLVQLGVELITHSRIMLNLLLHFIVYKVPVNSMARVRFPGDDLYIHVADFSMAVSLVALIIWLIVYSRACIMVNRKESK